MYSNYFIKVGEIVYHKETVKQAADIIFNQYDSVFKRLSDNRNGFNMIQWLDDHCGCDVDKMMHGDPIEIEKNRRHFELRNIVEKE